MSDTPVWLVTGANRGIGLGLVTALLQRPNTIVVAVVRGPNSQPSSGLAALSKAEGSAIIDLQIDSSVYDSAKIAIETLRSTHGITHIDVVIANAGMSTASLPPSRTEPEHLARHFAVNTIGPLLLFQATSDLLGHSKRGGKFVAVTSVVSSIALMDKFTGAGLAYAASKAALNFIVSRIHYERVDMAVLAIHPGWVQSDMGNAAALRMGMAKAPVTVEESVEKMLGIIDKYERQEQHAFLSYDGTTIPW